MPITAIDPRTALIVIDLQKGIAVFPLVVNPLQAVVSRANVLAEAFRAKALPVFLVVAVGGAPGRTELTRGAPAQFPPDFAELLPDVNSQPTDHRITKHTQGSFAHTELEARLRHEGVTQVVLVGVATSRGVESTARQAYELGFNVTCAVDAMSDVSLEDHNDAIQRVFPRIGETGSTEDVRRMIEVVP